MNKTNIKEKTMKNSFFSIICAGIGIGMVFFLILKRIFPFKDQHMVEEMLLCNRCLGNLNQAYLLFIIKQRLKSIILILFCTYLWNHKVSVMIFSTLIGIYSGLLLCMCCNDYYGKGLLLWFFFQFPHMILYLYALWLWQKMDSLYRFSIKEIKFYKMDYLKKTLQYFIVSVVIIVGIMLEYYVNTKIMEKIINFFIIK